MHITTNLHTLYTHSMYQIFFSQWGHASMKAQAFMLSTKIGPEPNPPADNSSRCMLVNVACWIHNTAYSMSLLSHSTLMPALLHFLTASGTFERGGSISDMIPTKHIPERGKLTWNQQRTGPRHDRCSMEWKSSMPDLAANMATITLSWLCSEKYAQHLFSIEWKSFRVLDRWETTLTKPNVWEIKRIERRWIPEIKYGSMSMLIRNWLYATLILMLFYC